MNQKAIWLIIGLMSAAVVGVMTLQLSFINSSRQLNEQSFDHQVRLAIKQVAQTLESSEADQLARYANGYSIRQPQTQASMVSSVAIQAGIDAATAISERSAEVLKQTIQSQLIEERINLVQLDRFLKQELSERGINEPFKYGIFSNASSSFVITDNHYLIPGESQAPYEYLKKTPYRINLFPSELNSPGLLMVYFPTRTAFIWQGLWNVLALSLLFVIIILGCFGYTIYVILRQKKLSEMKNDFINNMTHEFKTPIATISLASDTILSAGILAQPEKVKRFAEIIKQENKRMNGQVEKVLQMALIERDTLKLNFSTVNLHEVIEQAVGNAALQVERKDGTVQALLNAENFEVEGDLNHISNIFNNLLDNANKYSPEKPEIMVSTRNISSGVEVVVEDKGIGMSTEARKKIFEKFYRVPTGNLHDVKGFGLGLTYVKAMMTAHKGSIDVKSELGKGSRFILFFPFRVQNMMS